MSNYRDDSNDTAVASSSTWLNLSALTDSTAKIAEVVFFGLMVMHTDGAVASDQAIDRPGGMLVDQAVISDQALGHLSARVLVVDNFTGSERVIERLRVLSVDVAAVSDATTGRLRTVTTDGATITDAVLAQRRARDVLSDSARISDYTGQFAVLVVEDGATVSDVPFGKLRAKVMLEDHAALADEVLEARQAASAIAIDQARIAAVVFDQLHAADLIQDTVFAEAVPVGGGLFGQAWTANVDGWQMSRYAPYTFTSIAVLDGVLYGVAEDGVYALDGGADPVAGTITTGKVDVGQGALVHPVTALTEYELAGDGATAFMDVTTTQSGAAQTYAYALESEPAADLTNGRFKFGLGLRGRHFTFSLRLTGERAYINDLSVQTTPTKRRV